MVFWTDKFIDYINNPDKRIKIKLNPNEKKYVTDILTAIQNLQFNDTITSNDLININKEYCINKTFTPDKVCNDINKIKNKNNNLLQAATSIFSTKQKLIASLNELQVVTTPQASPSDVDSISSSQDPRDVVSFSTNTPSPQANSTVEPPPNRTPLHQNTTMILDEAPILKVDTSEFIPNKTDLLTAIENIQKLYSVLKEDKTSISNASVDVVVDEKDKFTDSDVIETKVATGNKCGLFINVKDALERTENKRSYFQDVFRAFIFRYYTYYKEIKQTNDIDEWISSITTKVQNHLTQTILINITRLDTNLNMLCYLLDTYDMISRPSTKSKRLQVVKDVKKIYENLKTLPPFIQFNKIMDRPLVKALYTILPVQAEYLRKIEDQISTLFASTFDIFLGDNTTESKTESKTESNTLFWDVNDSDTFKGVLEYVFKYITTDSSKGTTEAFAEGSTEVAKVSQEDTENVTGEPESNDTEATRSEADAYSIPETNSNMQIQSPDPLESIPIIKISNLPDEIVAAYDIRQRINISYMFCILILLQQKNELKRLQKYMKDIDLKKYVVDTEITAPLEKYDISYLDQSAKDVILTYNEIKRLSNAFENPFLHTFKEGVFKLDITNLIETSVDLFVKVCKFRDIAYKINKIQISDKSKRIILLTDAFNRLYSNIKFDEKIKDFLKKICYYIYLFVNVIIKYDKSEQQFLYNVDDDHHIQNINMFNYITSIEDLDKVTDHIIKLMDFTSIVDESNLHSQFHSLISGSKLRRFQEYSNYNSSLSELLDIFYVPFVEVYEELSGAVRVIVNIRDFNLTRETYEFSDEDIKAIETKQEYQYRGPFTLTKFTKDKEAVLTLDELVYSTQWRYDKGIWIDSSFQRLKLTERINDDKSQTRREFGNFFRVIPPYILSKDKNVFVKKNNNFISKEYINVEGIASLLSTAKNQNVVLMTYGYSGSGKTYILFGPMNKKHTIESETPKDEGIVIDLIQALQSKTRVVLDDIKILYGYLDRNNDGEPLILTDDIIDKTDSSLKFVVNNINNNTANVSVEELKTGVYRVLENNNLQYVFDFIHKRLYQQQWSTYIDNTILKTVWEQVVNGLLIDNVKDFNNFPMLVATSYIHSVTLIPEKPLAFRDVLVNVRNILIYDNLNDILNIGLLQEFLSKKDAFMANDILTPEFNDYFIRLSKSLNDDGGLFKHILKNGAGADESITPPRVVPIQGNDATSTPKSKHSSKFQEHRYRQFIKSTPNNPNSSRGFTAFKFNVGVNSNKLIVIDMAGNEDPYDIIDKMQPTWELNDASKIDKFFTKNSYIDNSIDLITKILIDNLAKAMNDIFNNMVSLFYVVKMSSVTEKGLSQHFTRYIEGLKEYFLFEKKTKGIYFFNFDSNENSELNKLFSTNSIIMKTVKEQFNEMRVYFYDLIINPVIAMIEVIQEKQKNNENVINKIFGVTHFKLTLEEPTNWNKISNQNFPTYKSPLEVLHRIYKILSDAIKEGVKSIATESQVFSIRDVSMTGSLGLDLGASFTKKNLYLLSVFYILKEELMKLDKVHRKAITDYLHNCNSLPAMKKIPDYIQNLLYSKSYDAKYKKTLYLVRHVFNLIMVLYQEKNSTLLSVKSDRYTIGIISPDFNYKSEVLKNANLTDIFLLSNDEIPDGIYTKNKRVRIAKDNPSNHTLKVVKEMLNTSLSKCFNEMLLDVCIEADKPTENRVYDLITADARYFKQIVAEGFYINQVNYELIQFLEDFQKAKQTSEPNAIRNLIKKVQISNPYINVNSVVNYDSSKSLEELNAKETKHFTKMMQFIYDCFDINTDNPDDAIQKIQNTRWFMLANIRPEFNRFRKGAITTLELVESLKST